jgi:predicted ATP-grasp superfamily ATP-dependent carboligase
MPRILVYEYLTALGIGRDLASPEHSLFREGRAMRNAVGEDIGRIRGHTRELADHPSALVSACQFDFVIVVAPEQGGQLFRVVCQTIEAGGHPICSSPPAIRLTSDKLAMADYWVRLGVATPHTLRAEQWRHDLVPVVIKPRDGAGSTDTYLIEEPVQFAAVFTSCNGPMIAQQFVPGRAASIVFLIGESRSIPLLPAFQRLSADGRFRYLGGELPIPPDLADRAVRLGRRAIECVPGLFGYVGVDLILGNAPDGSQDFAIEINPRLTTSYVGLRVLADFNIAEAMLNLATGDPLPEIRWKPGHVGFDPDGTVAYDPTPGAVGREAGIR